MKELKLTSLAARKASGGEVIGIASVAGNVDLGGDRIIFGAFAKSLARRLPLLLWSHDLDRPPIGKITAAREIGREALPQKVLSIAPDATGALEVHCIYFTETELGKAAYTAIAGGSEMGMSIGYNVLGENFTNEPAYGRVRNLTEIDLMEVSPCNFGMNPAAVASAKGYKYAGGLGGKAGARHSSDDREILNRLHADVVALGADCGTGKSAPSVHDLGLKLARLQIDRIAGSDAGAQWDRFMASLPAQYRRR